MNIVEIEVLFYFHLNPTAHPRAKVEEVRTAIGLLRHRGLIKPYVICCSAEGDQYTTTPKGGAYIRLLRSLEVPTLKEIWVDKDGKVIPELEEGS